ncbi:MAG TPA: Glu/Leu/Phe/Val dehydrogenase dimerization domain-containing protein [Pyrinomonadaceae bacterium]|jgi:Glutamate dehydrogenase/leucine dehydrogenase|nr:Glu/Leu/Phe/Val dehydrogenase dimerization domain-containing protein [Pyrinomonadaceae bacterium]
MKEAINSRSICELYAEAEHERVVLWADPSCGYRGIIAIHSTALGPAVGGTRLWNYDCEKTASLDALRLSKAMSYKNALAGLPFGGGKAVIIAHSGDADREQIFRAHGRFVESLSGKFITAEDIGTRPSDMEFVRKETSWVAGLPGGSGDPSPMTALGVFRSMQACAMHRWGSSELANKTVAIQGCGSTGYNLAKNLFNAGAKLIATDLDQSRLQKVVKEFAATAVAPEEIYSVPADIFAPCAFGGVINEKSIRQLKAEIVVGSANNQLLCDSDGELLAELEILYAPDCIANSGGMINGCRELLGWDGAAAKKKIDDIYDRMLAILNLAGEEKVPPYKTAERLARKLIRGN